MKKYVDQKMKDIEFQVGDKVMFRFPKRLVARPCILGWFIKYDGPFEVIKRVGKVAYRLKLPNHLKVHPNFHMSYLSPLMKV